MFVIGRNQTEQAVLELIPQKWTFEKKLLVSYFPLKYKDEVIERVTYIKNKKVNDLGLLGLREFY